MLKNNKIILLFILLLIATSCIKQNDSTAISSGYGVFIGLEGSEVIKKCAGYDTVVIDAQYVSKEDIAIMQGRGQTVYSYLNIGSIETFRPYYNDYKYLTLKPYLDWEEEFWMDLGNEEWQKFLIDKLSLELLEKNIDGFWVDNVDVYSHFTNNETYLGLERILIHLMSLDKAVILNSGDEFVKEYSIGHSLNRIMTGVNQETVFTSIDFRNETFGNQNETEKKYYLEYLNDMSNLNMNVYLLEYSTDSNLIDKIKDYSLKKGWEYYISKSIGLD